MHVGIDTFVELAPGQTPVQRTRELMEEIEVSDQAGVYTYSIGEHHRAEYVASSPSTLLAAAAVRTSKIRLGSAVTVLSSDDPIRLFQQFSTVDLLSNGRAEIVVGRGSFVESYPLFGFDLKNYDELFAEKLDLLLHLREETRVHWQGKFRTPLTGEGVWPRPVQESLAIRLGVGGTPASFARAGMLGLPLTVAIIGGEPHRFRPLVDLYRAAWAKAGHDPAEADIAVHTHGFVADTVEEAIATHWPAHAATFDRIGKERGWPPTSRAAYDAQRGPTAALIVGDPALAAEKMLYYNEVLGGISQLAINLSGGGVPHKAQLRCMELLGTQVGPLIAKA